MSFVRKLTVTVTPMMMMGTSAADARPTEVPMVSTLLNRFFDALLAGFAPCAGIVHAVEAIETADWAPV